MKYYITKENKRIFVFTQESAFMINRNKIEISEEIMKFIWELISPGYDFKYFMSDIIGDEW